MIGYLDEYEEACQKYLDLDQKELTILQIF